MTDKLLMREVIFKNLKEGLFLSNKNIKLIWCVELQSLKTLSDNYLFKKDYCFLNFGNCLIFEDFQIELSTSKLTVSGTKFTEIGGALNNNAEAKILHKRLENVIGEADSFSETYGEIQAHWENDFNKIIIYPRHHMGGEWFEYKIMRKNCHQHGFVASGADVSY